MSTEQFYSDGPDRMVQITGEDAHHIARSLRMAVGEEITVCDSQGWEYDCALIAFEEDRRVLARVQADRPASSEPPVQITLFQALPKADKLDTIIQKAVECGAVRIVPFESTNCVVKIKAEAESRKQERRTRIASEAAKQCGRGRLPSVEPTVSYTEMLTLATKADLTLFFYEGEGTCPLHQLMQDRRADLPTDRPPHISIIVGSEGGFTPGEVEMAKNAGCAMAGLGPRILRTETASCFVLGALIYEFEL